MIIRCKTNWEGPNSESFCELILEVHRDFLDSFTQNHVVRKKCDGLYFEFSTAEVDAFKGVEIVETYLELTST